MEQRRDRDVPGPIGRVDGHGRRGGGRKAGERNGHVEAVAPTPASLETSTPPLHGSPTPAAGSSVEKRTARHGPAAATVTWPAQAGWVARPRPYRRSPITPAGSAAPSSSLPAPKATSGGARRQAARQGTPVAGPRGALPRAARTGRRAVAIADPDPSCPRHRRGEPQDDGREVHRHRTRPSRGIHEGGPGGTPWWPAGPAEPPSSAPCQARKRP